MPKLIQIGSMELDIAKMTRREKPTLVALFSNKGYLIVSSDQYSFTADEDKATRFMDRYDVIEATFKLSIKGTYTVIDAGK